MNGEASTRTDEAGQGGDSAAFPFPNLMAIACGVFGLSVLLEIFCRRCLYADGAHEFIEVLQTQNVADFMWSRQAAFALKDFPVVAAIKLGVTNLHFLQLVFGLGCFLPWPVALMFCHWLSPKNFWIVVVACAAGYLNAAFMPVGEHIIAHAFFWPALFVILFARPLTPLAAAILLTSALILLFSYESLLFLGPPLAVLAGGRAICGTEKFWQRSLLLAAGALFVAATGVALSAWFRPELPANYSGFKVDALRILANPSWTMRWSGIWLLLMIAAWRSGTVCRLLAHRVCLAGLACVVALWGVWPLLAPDRLLPFEQHIARFLDLAMPLALLPVALAAAHRPALVENRRSCLATLAAGLLLAQSLWQISATWQWIGYTRLFRSVLASHTGPVLPSDTVLAGKSLHGQALRFDWLWVNPSMSILFSPNGKVNALILPEPPPLWQPFTPFVPGDLPHLERYGIDYDGYLSTLPNFREKLKARDSSTNSSVLKLLQQHSSRRPALSPF